MADNPTAPRAPQGRGVRLSAKRAEILGARVPFIKPEQLAELGEFIIPAGGFKRAFNRRFNREECQFTVVIPEGDQAGHYLLTLERNDYREAIGEQVKKLAPRSFLEHLVLVKTDFQDGSGYFWEFGEVLESGEVMRFAEDSE